MRHAATGVKLDERIVCNVRALAELGHRPASFAAQNSAIINAVRRAAHFGPCSASTPPLPIRESLECSADQISNRRRDRPNRAPHRDARLEMARSTIFNAHVIREVDATLATGNSRGAHRASVQLHGRIISGL